MGVKFIAACLTAAQAQACAAGGIPVMPPQGYARAWGEITPGCVTDFSLHCFNTETLRLFESLGVKRATLHPELNLAQIRDIEKTINTEVILYGRLPLMKLGAPQQNGQLTDRKQVKFPLIGNTLYNAVPLFMADKLKEVTKTGITHGRLLFTTETAEEVRAVINAYKRGKPPEIPFTRGKFFSRV